MAGFAYPIPIPIPAFPLSPKGTSFGARGKVRNVPGMAKGTMPIPAFGSGITLAMRMLASTATSRRATSCPLSKPSPSRGGQGGDGVWKD